MAGVYSDFMQKIVRAIYEYGDLHGNQPEVIFMHPDSAMLFDFNDNALIERYSPFEMRICGIAYEPNLLFEEGQFLLNNSRMRSIVSKFHLSSIIPNDNGGISVKDDPYWELYYVRADGGRIPGASRTAKSKEEHNAIRQEMIRELGNDYMPRANEYITRDVVEQQDRDRRYSMVMREVIENGYYFHGPDYDGYIKIAKPVDGVMMISAYVDRHLKFYCVNDDSVIRAMAEKYNFPVGGLEVINLHPLGDSVFPAPKYGYVIRD